MLTLKPHQRKAVDELSNGKILVGGVGTGKTLVSLTYFREKEDDGHTDLYVITTARKRDSLDWEREAAQLTISTDREASIGHIQLVVDSWNNIEKYKDVKDAFFIFDEQRVVGSGAWVKAFLRIAKQNRWIMLSATPGDTWLDYIPVFVANGFYKNRTQFKREHVVYNTFVSKYPKVDHYISVGKLVRLRNSIQVKMPYERHTTRLIREIPVEYDRELLRKVVKERWHVYENRPLRDVSELFSVMRKVVNSDEDRMRQLQDILSVHPRVIVFYNFDYELEILKGLIPKLSVDSERSKFTLDISKNKTTSNITSSKNLNASSVEASSVGVESHVHNSELNTADLKSDYIEDKTCMQDLSFPNKKTQKSSKPSSLEDTGNMTVKQLESRSESPSKEPYVQPVELTNGISSKQESGSSLNLSKDGDIFAEDLRSQLSGDQELQESVEIAEWNDPSLQFAENDQKENKSWKNIRANENGNNNTPLPAIPVVVDTGVTTEMSVKEEDEKQLKNSSLKPLMTEQKNFVMAEWNGHRHDPVPTGDRWVYLVQYVAGAEAWNCTSTDTVVFYSLTYSYKNFEQAQGRIDRLDTSFLKLFYYVLISKAQIDVAIAKSLKSKKSFNEADFMS